MKGPRVVVTILLAVACAAPLAAWKNPSKSPSLNAPIFGTHDWVAYKGYVLAGRPAFIRNNLNRFFIGTEAPDNGMKPSDAEGGYQDAVACHCILFDEDGNVTKARGELRVDQEFDKAVAALHAAKPALAAFYAGALAHYMGDLGQFYHVMGRESHWGAEDQRLHSAYEVAVESTIRFKTRTSVVFEGFISPIAIGGDTPEEVARAVALRTERGTGTSGRTPGDMDARFKLLKRAGHHTDPGNWDAGFRTQTGQNMNVAANGIAKLFLLMVEDD